MNKKIRNVILVCTLLVAVSFLSFKLGENKGFKAINPDAQLDLKMMWQVKDKLSKTFLEKEKVNDKKELVYGAIKGMVDSLGDPYTVFLTPKENKSQNEDLSGVFGGVGISLGYKEKQLAVISPLARTPAANAGILAGDLILKITDKSKKIEKETYDISLNEAVEMIRGRVGTEVILKIFREGKKEPFDVTLTRENITVPSMELEWKEKDGKKIAWVKLYKFTEQLYNDWPKTVDDILSEESKNKDKFGGIVLDLRNNPGGYLQASVLVGSDFINNGIIVEQQTSNGKKETYEVDKTRRKLLEEKLVVLINGGSASAAEILAGAIRDHGRAKLIGEKSFGKGTVQEPEDFKDGSGLHITIAKWLLPSGKNIHKVGINPDVEVKFEPNEKDVKADNQLDKAMEVLSAK